MKATQRDFASVAGRFAQNLRVYLFCGPDEAGAQEAAAAVIAGLPAGSERIDLSGTDLRRDPVLLGDEARSISLFGGARYILVRSSGDEAAEALGVLLSGGPDPCPVLVLAAGASDKSRCAKLLIDRPDALVAVFWPPDLKAVAASVRSIAEQKGVRLDGPAAERIARAAGQDLRLARSEIDKIALYLDASPEAPRTADAAVIDLLGASTNEDGFMPIVNAVLAGENAKLASELARMRALALNPVAVLLAVERRASQLAGLAARLGPGGDIRQLIEAEKAARRIFWKEERDLAAQLMRWRGQRLAKLVDKLVSLHRSLLANSQFAEVLLAQGLAEICRASSARN